MTATQTMITKFCTSDANAPPRCDNRESRAYLRKNTAVLDEELAAPLHADSLDEAQALVDKFNEETQPAVESIKLQFRQIDQLGRALYASKEADAQSAFSQYDLNMLNQRGGAA